MNFPSADQSHGPQNPAAKGDCPFPVSLSSLMNKVEEPSQHEKYTSRRPSGDQSDSASSAGPKAKRVRVSCVRSCTQMSLDPVRSSAIARETFCPSGESRKAEYPAGAPTCPASRPLRSNQTNRVIETLLAYASTEFSDTENSDQPVLSK